ncbi:MAG TPA: hypothetical protein P5556_00005 [Candidatus Gastranaerophilales bacterium]|nr:hypothetical protein [Candidatus Gastranaerophilales bacterium]
MFYTIVRLNKGEIDMLNGLGRNCAPAAKPAFGTLKISVENCDQNEKPKMQEKINDLYKNYKDSNDKDLITSYVEPVDTEKMPGSDDSFDIKAFRLTQIPADKTSSAAVKASAYEFGLSKALQKEGFNVELINMDKVKYNNPINPYASKNSISEGFGS